MSREHTGPSPRVIRTRKSLNTTRRLIPGAHEILISLIVFIRAARDRDSAHGSAHSLINDPSPRAPPPHRLQRRLQRRLQKCLQRCLRPSEAIRGNQRQSEAISGACVRLSDRRAGGRSASSTTRTKGDCRRAQGQEGCGSVSRRWMGRSCRGRSWEIVGVDGWVDHVVGVPRMCPKNEHHGRGRWMDQVVGVLRPIG